jgi:spore maturation protein CgeB
VYEYGNYYHSAQRLGDGCLPNSVDMLVYCECNDEEPQYTELRTFNADRKIYWDFDIHTHPEKTLRFASTMGFTHIFFANKIYEPSFRKINSHVNFLPYGFDDEFLRPMPEVSKTVDVGFCGSEYPERVAFIAALRRAGINAELVSGQYGADLVKTITSFKIHLNYLVGGGRGLLNARVFETIGCGTLLLNENEDFVDQLFTDGKHLVLYGSEDECIERARYFLKHQDEREEIARAGHEYGLSNHTYLIRAKTILEAVNKSAAKAKEDIDVGLQSQGHYLS